MKKKILAGLVATMVVGSVTAMAAPTEIEQGKWDVSIGAQFSPTTDVNGHDWDGETGTYGTVTYGMTDQWAIQYDYSHYGADRGGSEFSGDANEVNLLYKLNPNLNAYAGYTYFGADVKEGRQDSGANTSGFQVGLQGHYPIADKLNLNGKVGIGTDSQVYELGVGYDIADSWTLDVGYRYAEYDDVGGADLEFKGVRAGLSTSF